MDPTTSLVTTAIERLKVLRGVSTEIHGRVQRQIELSQHEVDFAVVRFIWDQYQEAYFTTYQRVHRIKIKISKKWKYLPKVLHFANWCREQGVNPYSYFQYHMARCKKAGDAIHIQRFVADTCRKSYQLYAKKNTYRVSLWSTSKGAIETALSQLTIDVQCLVNFLLRKPVVHIQEGDVFFLSNLTRSLLYLTKAFPNWKSPTEDPLLVDLMFVPSLFQELVEGWNRILKLEGMRVQGLDHNLLDDGFRSKLGGIQRVLASLYLPSSVLEGIHG